MRVGRDPQGSTQGVDLLLLSKQQIICYDVVVYVLFSENTGHGPSSEKSIGCISLEEPLRLH